MIFDVIILDCIAIFWQWCWHRGILSTLL